MTDSIIDVLIVGAGPTGTALAVDLARRGHSIRIIDKAAASFDGSRAKGVQPRTLEVFQDLGVLQDVQAGGADYPRLGIHLGPLTIPWRMIANAPRTPFVPFPRTWLIPQSRTDAALHARLTALGHRVDFGHELVDVRQDKDAAVASLSGPDGAEEEVVARYIVGADGGSSAVRKSLGIDFPGSTHEEDRIIIVDGVTSGLSRNRWHMWPARGGGFVGACPLPHSELFQWMIRLQPEEEPKLDLASINARLQRSVRNRRVVIHDIQWQSVFRPNIRLAARYRQGRVFLAGDAAHVHPPAGAQGLNTGIQDAYNLGWKLGQVLAGADPVLLDSYEAERRPIAESVLALATKKYDGIAKADPSSIRRGKDETQLTLSYHDGPLVTAGAARTTTLQVGDRAPDADLVSVDGRKVRLFDSFVGPHFTVIAQGKAAMEALKALRWPAAGAALSRVVIADGGRAAMDEDFADREDSFRRGYGVAGDLLVLIRPDGYIGHIATTDLATSTQAAIDRMTLVSTRSAP